MPKLHGGTGTELKALLAKVGITGALGCSCNRHAAEMDRQGPAWCRANLEKIVGWLRTEAARRHPPFVGLLATQVIRLAIARAERSAKA